MDSSRSHRHYSRELPRFWVALPLSVRRSALDDPLLSALFPSHAGYFPAARQHRAARSAGLTSTIFNYCVAGRGWCRLRGVRHEVGPGDLMVVPAGEPHAYASNPGDAAWTLHWFHAMGTNVARFRALLGVTPLAPVVHLGRSPELEGLFTEMREALEDELSDEALLDATQTLSHLLGVVLRLRRQPKTRPNAAERVRSSLEHARHRLGEAFSVNALAALAELSPSRYAALVHRTTGSTPKAYLTRVRVERAAELLASTDLSVKTIAREVGFTDPLHFSRVFRRVSGESPRRHRARSRRD